MSAAKILALNFLVYEALLRRLSPLETSCVFCHFTSHELFSLYRTWSYKKKKGQSFGSKPERSQRKSVAEPLPAVQEVSSLPEPDDSPDAERSLPLDAANADVQPIDCTPSTVCTARCC